MNCSAYWHNLLSLFYSQEDISSIINFSNAYSEDDSEDNSDEEM